ncbi:MAG: hypothetical protein LBH41_02620, partial [Rickettsiales bacterium]|nr:hypothetical protein [Rickettsiales bacterium]
MRKKYIPAIAIAAIIWADKPADSAYYQCTTCPKDYYCPNASAAPISCESVGGGYITDSVGAVSAADCKSPYSTNLDNILLAHIDQNYSATGNAGGVGAGASGGWYMAAVARSTTIRIRNSKGVEWEKNLGSLEAGKDYYVFVKNGGGIAVQTGSSLANATRIGGFHTMCCSTTGLGSNHLYYNYAAGQIMPSSVWTNKHHPEDTTGGYVYLANLDDSNYNNNMTTAELNRSPASRKPWVMIYPGTAYSGSSPTNAGTGYVLRSVPPQDA